MAQWTLDLKKYAEIKKKQIKIIHKDIAFKVYSSIVEKTPVDTGRARGNWQVNVNNASGTYDEDKIGQQIFSKDEIPESDGDSKYIIENNLPYITTLEYGLYPNPSKSGTKTVNGFSKQAPNGMVGLTLAKVDSMIKEAIKESESEK